MANADRVAAGLTDPCVGWGEPSTAATELKGSPVALTPSLRRASAAPSAEQTRAKTKGLATLMIVNGCSASPALNTVPVTPTTHTPNSSGSAAASAGYTWEGSPSEKSR